jgi:L-alanine-DL-glutamate epimerase-like enolase superfamily enzyme
MKVVAAEWLPYRLPLKRPWQTSQGVLKKQSGSLLRLETKDGQTGWGDCAPLPEFGINETNATSFAEELAHLDLFSQKLGQPLNSWLSNTAAVTSVAVNANLGSISDINQGLVETALKSGFSILKIKVGVGHWQDEVEHLRHLCDGLPPGASLRLDANMAWSEAEAGLFISACTHLPIEGLEEPLRHPDHGGLARLQTWHHFQSPLMNRFISLMERSFITRRQDAWFLNQPVLAACSKQWKLPCAPKPLALSAS